MPTPGTPTPLLLHDLAATHRLARAAMRLARPGDAIMLEGELGAGKSEFARAFLRAAAGDEALEVPSPTFTLIQSYETAIGPVHHYDLWRLDGPHAMEELAWEDARADIVLVEWPERLGELRPVGALTVRFSLDGGEARKAELTGWPDRLPALLQTFNAAPGPAGNAPSGQDAAGLPVPSTAKPGVRSAGELPASPVREQAAQAGDAQQPDATTPNRRDDQITLFLAANGYDAAQTAPLAQDASFRRYLRVTGGPRPAVLMDAPPPEQVEPFLRVAAHLQQGGLSVPEILAADPRSGLILEEDLGDHLFGTILTESNAPALFDAAIDALVALQRAAPLPDLPTWSADEMRDTALGTLFDWWWPAQFGGSAPDAARADFASALDTMLLPLRNGPRCLVHRDWFAGNLIWLPDRTGVRRVGIIDFQGAALGHPAYDLVSVLQDARRDLSRHLQDSALTRYLTARPELDARAFRTAYDACAAQRHLRVACQWVRLAVRDHKPNYLAFGPRTWHLLAKALLRPAAAPLAAAFDRWIAPAARGNPPGLAV